MSETPLSTPLIYVSDPMTRQDAEAFMNSPPMLAWANACYDAVQRECEAGLSPDDLATFRLWWSGGKVDWDAIGSGPAYGAIMQAISMGCG